jgi:glycine oxidase
LKIDYLISGQGLAGSLVAWHLLARGQRVLVVDRDEEGTSSKVAAGLVTPLAGARFNLPEGLDERLNYARKFYWDLEEAGAGTLFHHRRIARLFQNEKERTTWEQRLASEGARYERYASPLEIDRTLFRYDHGGFEMREGGWLDVPSFLEYTRISLLERASYAIGRIDAEDVDAKTEGIRWKNIIASKIIFCEGWRGNQNRFFDWIPMNPALGDILEVDLPALSGEQRIISRGGWIIPVGEGRFRVGSSYYHHSQPEPSLTDRREALLQKLSTMTPAEVSVIQHRSAIRPVIRRSQVYLGSHPAHSNVAFFNGLGSKGVINGPWHAKRLVDYLLDGHPLPPESDLRNNHF